MGIEANHNREHHQSLWKSNIM